MKATKDNGAGDFTSKYHKLTSGGGGDPDLQPSTLSAASSVATTSQSIAGGVGGGHQFVVRDTIVMVSGEKNLLVKNHDNTLLKMY